MTARNVSDATAAVLSDIEGERLRQIRKEGWSTSHDDEHDEGEIALAAACYALPEGKREHRKQTDFYDAEDRCAGEHDYREVTRNVPHLWPSSWACWFWKPKDRRRDLVRAAALLVAEIERLDRKSALHK